MSDRALIATVLAFAAVLFVVGIGRGSLWDQDEAKYTQVAREILLTRDPITLHVNGRPWFVHPPLYMWLQALTGGAFGFSEVSARIPPSPWLSARSTNTRYLTEITSSSDQQINESTPSTFAGLGASP